MVKKSKPVKKAAPKKAVAKKAPVKKVVAKKTTQTVVRTIKKLVKKAPQKKVVAKKTAVKKPIAKKPITKKTITKKSVAKKTVVKKAISKKPAVKAINKKAAPVKAVPVKVVVVKSSPPPGSKVAARNNAAPVIQLPDATVEKAANTGNEQMMVPGDGLNGAPLLTNDPVTTFDQNTFNRATAKGDPQSNMRLSSVSKGPKKPAGKKPLWR